MKLNLPPIRAGMRLRPLKNIVGPRAGNIHQSVCNGILNLKIVRGEQDKFEITENNATLTLQRVGDSSGSGVRYRGEYDANINPPYLAGDMVVVSPPNDWAYDPSVPGTYICLQDNPNPEANFPKNPLQPGGLDPFWGHIATYPSIIKVCNDENDQIEDWIIDAQKKPEVTADTERVRADSETITADS